MKYEGAAATIVRPSVVATLHAAYSAIAVARRLLKAKSEEEH